jgi:hypothetical protein
MVGVSDKLSRDQEVPKVPWFNFSSKIARLEISTNILKGTKYFFLINLLQSNGEKLSNRVSSDP